MAVNFWDSEFQIHTSHPNGSDFVNQSMTVLNDGRIVVVWRGSGATGGDGDGTESFSGIKGRILNPDGSLTGTEFTVNSTTLNGQDAGTVTTLTDGRFVVTWHSNENGDGGSGGNLTIRARVFNADGTPALYNGSTNDFVVNDQARFNDIVPVVVAVPGGGFVIAWQSPTAPFGNHDISMRVFTNNGPAGNQAPISTFSSHDGEPAMTALLDGRFVVGWREAMGGADDMVARIFNADGSPATSGGTKFTLSTSTLGDQFQLDLATLSDGRFVAVWSTNTGSDGGAGDGNGPGIRARVFNADGTADMSVNGGNDFLVNTTTHSEQTRPQVTALNDGRFFISFSSKGDPSGNFEDNVIGRLFNANGTPDGNDFVIKEGATAGGGAYNLPNALVTTLDGRVLSLYAEMPGNDVVQGRFLDFTTTGKSENGNASANTLIGTLHADVLDGLGGDDRLYGGDGNDVLRGGAGADLLSGGLGADTADYSASDAAVSVNLLSGAVSGGHAQGDTLAGIENVTGSAFNDILTGNAGANVLIGGAGVDQLFGGEGDDTIVWDATDDLNNVLGGGGTDTLRVVGGALPTTFGLAAHEFEQAQMITNDPGGNSWSQIIDSYNTGWQLTSSDFRYDDNTRVVTTFDYASGNYWNSITQFYNAAAQNTSIAVYYDNGARHTITLDYANVNYWNEIYNYYDTAGQNISATVFYDNAERHTIAIDFANANFWNEIYSYFNASGQNTLAAVFYDNGGRHNITVDYNNANYWNEIYSYYNSSGQNTSATAFHDDGGRHDISVDYNNLNYWNEIYSYSNAAGQNTSATVFYDNGGRHIITVDYNNSNTWTEIYTYYNAAGQNISEKVFYDNGTRTETYYDPDPPNAANWTSFVDYYNAAGIKTRQTGIYDDGQTWEYLY